MLAYLRQLDLCIHLALYRLTSNVTRAHSTQRGLHFTIQLMAFNSKFTVYLWITMHAQSSYNGLPIRQVHYPCVMDIRRSSEASHCKNMTAARYTHFSNYKLRHNVEQCAFIIVNAS